MIAVDLRAAMPSDAERLFGIQRDASLAAFGHIFPPAEYPYPDDAIRAEWDARLVDGVTETLIGEGHGRPVGFVSYRPGQLVSLFVLRDHQGSGVGSILHDAALAAHRDLGAAACRLWVLEANEEARAFYERRGWRPDGRGQTAPYAPFPQEVGYTIEL